MFLPLLLYVCFGLNFSCVFRFCSVLIESFADSSIIQFIVLGRDNLKIVKQDTLVFLVAKRGRVMSARGGNKSPPARCCRLVTFEKGGGLLIEGLLRCSSIFGFVCFCNLSTFERSGSWMSLPSYLSMQFLWEPFFILFHLMGAVGMLSL